MALAKYNTTPRVSKASASKFMALLMQPVLDAELEDPELKRLEDRARIAAKKRDGHTWIVGFIKVQEALYLRKAASYRSMIEDNSETAVKLERAADRAYYNAVAEQMRIPAALIRHLRWKQEHSKLDGREKDFAPLIEADRLRLEGGK